MYVVYDTVKPRPEEHMDMILFKVFFEEYPLDSTRSDSTVTLSIIRIVPVVISIVVESSRCSSKTLQNGSCPYAPLDEAFTVVVLILQAISIFQT